MSSRNIIHEINQIKVSLTGSQREVLFRYLELAFDAFNNGSEVAIVSRKNKLNGSELEELASYSAERQWLDRAKLGYPRDTSPFLFIVNQYNSWIERGLTRAQLRHVDESLVKRLENWLLDASNSLPPGFLGYGEMGSDIPEEFVKLALRSRARERKRQQRSKMTMSHEI